MVALMIVIAGLLLSPPRSGDAAADGNNPPTNVSCQGWQRDTVIISWKDNDNDEADYRVERSIDGAAFSEIATVAANGTSYNDTGVDVNKRYQYRVRGRHADNSFTGYGPTCSKRRIFETSNTPNNGFRIFFGLAGTTDDCPAIDGNRVCLANTPPTGTNAFVALQQTALEGSADAFGRVGFDRDAAAPNGGLDKIPVNVVWCDGGGCAGGESLGLSPFLMETAFDLGTRVGDPIAYLVGEHEVFHFQQFKYGGLNDPAGGWVIEGQARSSQDKVCIGANRGSALCFDDVTGGYAGYVPEINGYLANTGTPINRSEYAAALFWTYLTEKFGTSASGDATEAGMNLMVEFWKASAATPNRDGIAVLNSALQTLGTPRRFRDIWKDFAVANYAKNLTGSPVPDKYKYADMAQTGGAYNAVTFTANQPLNLNVPFLRPGETVDSWAARYYRFTPANNVPLLDIRITQDTNVPLYYTVLGIKNNGIAYEFNTEGRNFNQALLNNAYNEVVVVVAGLESLANYRVSINGTQPTLSILSPTTANRARVGAITAPEKFRVAVQVLASDGTPLSGVDLAKFNFRIGDRPVPADQILTSALIQDQEWFVVRAITQTVAGQYDLRVDYDNSPVLVATQTLAVDYTPRTDADNVLIIDRSGSMSGPKLDAAKNAARLYVDSWRFGDMIGVVAFDHEITLDMALQGWTDNPSGGTRQVAFNAIGNLTARGATHIGDALMKGFSELKASGNTAHDWALVLLSDGVEEASTVPITVDFPTAITNIAGDPGKRPVIHAIAIGPSADGPKMQNAAMATGGTYQFVSAPVAASVAGMATTAGVGGVGAVNAPTVISNARLDLDARYRFIATDVLGQQQFFTFVGPLVGDIGGEDSDNVTIPMEFSAAEMVLSLSFDGGCGGNSYVCDVVSLRDSLGAEIPIAETDFSRHWVWRASTPKSGDWHLFIHQKLVGPNAASADGPQQPNAELKPYLIQSSVKSDVILDADFPVPAEDRVSGVPMPIVASLTDIAPIAGATVIATIVSPDSIVRNLSLLDDGLHGDGAAADGIYANTFYQTGVAGTESGAGSYNVTINAYCFSPNCFSGIASNFTRQKVLGFFIYSSGDDDADLLPNEYEKARCGSFICLDAGDPDGDNRTTVDEWMDGTDPLDPDTDNGGESDGSEKNRQPTAGDPLDPSDDGVEPTWTVAYPGINQVFVRYAPRPAYGSIQVYRSNTFSGTYTFLAEDFAPTGMVTDTTALNEPDQEYCYYVIGITPSGAQSSPLTPSCANPGADPWPPDGGFLINNGASKTTSTAVTLNVFASDAVSPHALEPGSLDALMVPPGSSATTVTEMRFSNFGDLHDAVFEPFTATKPWTLGQASGLATVYGQFRDAAGNVSRIIPNAILIGTGGGGGDLKMTLPFIVKR
jgi:hypothetical protein